MISFILAKISLFALRNCVCVTCVALSSMCVGVCIF